MSGIANVISPPYDVISGGNLEHLRAADPHNVVRLILPGEDADAPRAAACLLREWLSDGVLIQDRIPHLYLYEQAADQPAGEAWRQRGIIGLVRLGSPDTAGILPHENVMPGPVTNRRELMAATRANLEPIFLVYDGEERLGEGSDTLTATEVIDHVADQRTPLLSIDTEDGVTHRLWRLDDPAECEAITADLATRRALIADGHHRYAAYLGLQAEIRATGAGKGPWDYGLALLVDSVACPPRLGAIHRVLPGMALNRAAELAKAAFTVETLPAGTDLAQALARLAGAGREGTAFLLAGQCGYRLLSHPDPMQVAASMPPETSPHWQALDASVLQQLLMGRLWGITDNEQDVLIYHDAAEAAAAVGAGGAAGTGGTGSAGDCGPADDLSADDLSADDLSADDLSADDLSADDLPADDLPADDLPADNLPGAGGTAVILNPVPFEAVREIAEQGERVPRKSTSFGPKPRTGLVLRTFGSREPSPICPAEHSAR